MLKNSWLMFSLSVLHNTICKQICRVDIVPVGSSDLSGSKAYPCCIGPSGKHFDMTEQSLQIGRPFLLAAFQATSNQDFPRRPEGQPMITTGSLCCYDWDFELAAATRQGGR